MPFLPPNQQRQSTEGTILIFDRVIQKLKRWTFWGHSVYFLHTNYLSDDKTFV